MLKKVVSSRKLLFKSIVLSFGLTILFSDEKALGSICKLIIYMQTIQSADWLRAHQLISNCAES